MNNNAESISQDSHALGKHALRLIVSEGLFVLIFRAEDFREVLDVLKASNLWLLLPALGLQILRALVAAMRWHMIMRELSCGKNLSF